MIVHLAFPLAYVTRCLSDNDCSYRYGLSCLFTKLNVACFMIARSRVPNMTELMSGSTSSNLSRRTYPAARFNLLLCICTLSSSWFLVLRPFRSASVSLLTSFSSSIDNLYRISSTVTRLYTSIKLWYLWCAPPYSRGQRPFQPLCQ